MKKLKTQLNSIAKSIARLSDQVDKAIAQVDAVQDVRPQKKTKAKASASSAPGKKARPAAKRAGSTAKGRKKSNGTVLENVFNAIKNSKKGTSVVQLRKKTGLQPRQLSNALYKLSKNDRIVAVSRGVYMKK